MGKAQRHAEAAYRNKLNNAYKPENDKEFSALRMSCFMRLPLQKAAKSQILHNSIRRIRCRLKKIKDQIEGKGEEKKIVH